MGGTNSKYEGISKIDREEWQKLEDKNGVQIVKSNKGYGEGEVRVISLDPRHTLENQLQIYNYRKNQNNALVSCYGVEPLKSKSSTMCGNEQDLKVLTERIPKRWSQLPQLTFPEAIYALSQSLRGYDDLYRKAGSFEITENMLGINSEGHLKVWCNEDFAENHPAIERPFLQTTTKYEGGSSQERDMVRNVFSVVQERCQEGRYPADFRERMERQALTFEDAENQVENYANEKNIYVPYLIHPNPNLLITKESVPLHEQTTPMHILQSGSPSISGIPAKLNSGYHSSHYSPPYNPNSHQKPVMYNPSYNPTHRYQSGTSQQPNYEQSYVQNYPPTITQGVQYGISPSYQTNNNPTNRFTYSNTYTGNQFRTSQS